MKAILIYACLSLAIFNVKAQSPKLDEKNGFNIFKLGETLSEVKKKQKVSYCKKCSNDKRITFFYVDNTSDFQIFDYPIQGLLLGFYENELYQIQVYPLYNYGTEKNLLVVNDILKRIGNEYGPLENTLLTVQDKVRGITEKFELYGNRVVLRFTNDGENCYYTFFKKNILTKLIMEEKTNGL